ncbi:hypothetical protein DQ04_05151010 [Trypanosoma grayi]|uniref:hypothetical protein n=1 Tax=Trypanosoma grayi TaxID=71804 RepID=UPI0004F4227A|nr:hypothetical protein DQ04_05151010 [Trypanosoma grayi]KEG09476.1 hypothetical protein DQ04_05151010 [Trypanosoma grayi]
MHSWVSSRSTNNGGGGNGFGASSVDMLAEERSSLQLIIDALNVMSSYYDTGRMSGNSSRNSNGSGGVVVTEAEAVDLLGMLPRVLRSSIASTTLQQKEQHRQLVAADGVARPPQLSRLATLYRLLFTPLLSSSSSSESDVLNCIARVMMCGCGARSSEASVWFQTDFRQVTAAAEMEQGKAKAVESVTIAALHSLSDIVWICLHEGEEIRSPSGGHSSASRSSSTAPSSGVGVLDSEMQMLLRDALGRSLCQSGLFEHLWRSVLFLPIEDTQRVAVVRILYDVSRAGVLRLPTVIAQTRYSTLPDVWGERVAECILSDPAPVVKECLAAMLREGLLSALVSRNNGGDNHGYDYLHWRRWLTNASLWHLLRVVALETCFEVLQPVLCTLLLALEQEHLQQREGRQCQRRAAGSPSEGRIDLVAVVTVCSTTLAHLFSGPGAVNVRVWGVDNDAELRTSRLRVSGVVRLLRLALQGVDRLLMQPGESGPRNGSDADAVKEACLLLRTCLDKQVMTATLKCVEKPPHRTGRPFATRAMRTEMVRLLRDLVERASPPLFFLAGNLGPYVPAMLQVILDAGEDCAQEEGSCGVADGSLPPCSPSLCQVCSETVEMVLLLGVAMWQSPAVREQFTATLAALQCTPAQRGLLFDVLENLAQTAPAHAVESLLVVDAVGVVVNEPSRLRWTDNQPQLSSVQRLLQQQRQKADGGVRRRASESAMPEERWAAVQQQRHTLGLQHTRAAGTLLWFILHHLRSDRGKTEAQDEEEEEEASGVSLSPIQLSGSGSTVKARVESEPDGVVAVVAELQKDRCRDDDVPCLESPPHTLIRHRHHEEKSLESERHDGTTDALWLYQTYGIHPPIPSRHPPRQQQEKNVAITTRATKIVSAPVTNIVVHRNTVSLWDRVRQRQLESTAAEESAYHAALGLFASLASRYYRHLLTPQAALKYLQQQQRVGPMHPPLLRPHESTHTCSPLRPATAGRNSGAALRLWTARDVRKEDLFLFVLPIQEVKEAALVALVERCRSHQKALQRSLRIAPQAPRGRRWFLDDAATNIMGRLIALLQILLQHIQREGEQAVQDALAQMPPFPVEVMELNDEAAHRRLYESAKPQELHCGTVVEVTKFVVRSFARDAKPVGGEVAVRQTLRPGVG